MSRPTCEIILYSKYKRILLQHRDSGAPFFSNHWSLFGGGVEEGEDIETTIKREIKEEISYDLKNPKLLISGKMTDGPHAGSALHIFAEEYDGKQKLVQHEGDDMRWFKFSEIDDLQMIPHDKRFIKILEKKILKL